MPFRLLVESKHDTVALEMLACALLIKARHSDSVLYLQVTNVMRCLGVSYKKAKKIIERIKESDFFIYNESKNCAFAKSFKSTERVTYKRGRQQYNAVGDSCRKVKVQDGDSLRTMKGEFRNSLLFRALHANKQDHFNVGVNSDVEKLSRRRAMTGRQLGGVIGMSKSSGLRYVRRLIDERRVGKSGIVAECVIECLNDVTEAEWYMRHPERKLAVWHNDKSGHYSGWIVYGFVYSITSRDDEEAMKHVIWNHRGRLGTDNSHEGMTPDGEGYWSKFNGKSVIRRSC